ncbi:PHP domain-containing protein [Geobacter pelophilus]|uniref:PHP domain-containing protein n=1 Tax=Geoanaerobacter pelophilus TaxID=60036 RepID=A0AAW4L4F7_9BACT|nr:PHP domain-containing protein [Geoanaerobacter pelophilus]MBT0664415.1 PHP domain-containing protein [Geoanaerobacter pelophilus]
MTAPVDLHIHSRHSDGTFSPTELVKMASAQGFKAIALADHDSISGIDEAIAAGEEFGVELIPAVELSIEIKNYHDVHLLAFFLDHKDKSFNERLNSFRERRDRRGEEIIARINDKLANNGKGSISFSEVVAGSDGALGRPHIARVLISRGYVTDMNQAFDEYLIPCDVPKEYFPAEEAIKEIHRIGGLAVLAHPTTISKDRSKLREVIGMMVAFGLDGLEAYNTLATIDDSEFLFAIARRHKLIVTGGSDFHGNEGEGLLGIRDNRFPLDYRLVESLKDRVAEKKSNQPQAV